MVGVLVGARPGTVTTGDWIAWSQTNDATGRVRTDVTTFASAIATTAGIDPSTDAAAPVSTDPQIDVDHGYSYDKAGALVKVEDLTGLPVAAAAVSLYTTRGYTFTTNGAREILNEQVHADGTPNGPETAGVQQHLTYDSADRPTGGYAYDEFGRQKTLPAAHAPNAGRGMCSWGTSTATCPRASRRRRHRHRSTSISPHVASFRRVRRMGRRLRSRGTTPAGRTIRRGSRRSPPTGRRHRRGIRGRSPGTSAHRSLMTGPCR